MFFHGLYRMFRYRIFHHKFSELNFLIPNVSVTKIKSHLRCVVFLCQFESCFCNYVVMHLLFIYSSLVYLLQACTATSASMVCTV